MRIDILTLFPKMFYGPFQESIIKRAVERGIVEINIHDIRDYARDKHHTVDDYPYGGGHGMVMKLEPVFEALNGVQAQSPDRGLVILLTPQGRPFQQQMAADLAGEKRLVLLCGHYEGVDERIREHLVDDEVSIGDYVLSGGELPAMVVLDAVARLIPGVLGAPESILEESHVLGRLEYPQYTRPSEFRGWGVPEVLLSGNHEEVARWRRRESVLRTNARRPDLLARACPSEEEQRWLKEMTTAAEGDSEDGP